MGFSPMVKVTGSTSEINAFSSVLESSRVVYELLHDDVSIGVISEALADKSKKASTFAHATGHPWPF